MNQGGQEAEKKLSGEMAGRWQQHRRSAFSPRGFSSIHTGGWRGERSVFLAASLGAQCSVPDKVPFFSLQRLSPVHRKTFLVCCKPGW